MRSLFVFLFISLIVYIIVSYKMYKFNSRTREFEVKYKNVPYSVVDMTREKNINQDINIFESDLNSNLKTIKEEIDE